MSQIPRPTGAFVAASWAALILGAVVFVIGLWNGAMALSERGFYFVLFFYGMFSAVSLQKSVRDRIEGIRVSPQYYLISWVSMGMVLALLVLGLVNATISLSEKGFFAMAFLLALFGVIAVQKNTRDVALIEHARYHSDD